MRTSLLSRCAGLVVLLWSLLPITLGQPTPSQILSPSLHTNSRSALDERVGLQPSLLVLTVHASQTTQWFACPCFHHRVPMQQSLPVQAH